MDRDATTTNSFIQTCHSSTPHHQQHHYQEQQLVYNNNNLAVDHSSSGGIDLGLSLKTMDHHPFYIPPSDQFVLPETGYVQLDNPPQNPIFESHNFTGGINPDTTIIHPFSLNLDVEEEETEAVESRHCRQHYEYVKVNMDGVPVGRKICIISHRDYSSLALQLNDMFGRFSLSGRGLRLFQDRSKFSLIYKDVDGKWRAAGDVPWQEFVDSARRLRIVNSNELCPL